MSKVWTVTKWSMIVLSAALVILLSPYVVMAVPTTQAVSDITATQVWFHGTADPAAVIGWFAWGGISGGPYYWTTPNQTVTGGAAYEDYQYGPPMLTCSTYYVVACDDTGCGNEMKWTTPAPTMLNLTHYGAGAMTIMRSGWNVTKTMDVIIAPYTNTITAPVTWFLLFFFIMVGYWLRQKDTFIPMALAMVSGAVIWGSSALGALPPLMMDVGQGLFIAAFAGYAFSIFTK